MNRIPFRRCFRPKSNRFRLSCRQLEERVTPDATPHNLAVSNAYQNWTTATLITANDDWAGVPNVMGFLGDDTFAAGIDPQTILTPYSTIDVIANQLGNTALTDGGVAEFDGLSNPVVALQGDGTAAAPNLVVFLNTTDRANIAISYSLRDVDATTDNAIQPVALQYRIGNAGNFINLPAGFVADATTGPSLATKVTPVNVRLPSAVDNQPEVQLRIITTNAIGSNEWIGVDDIVVRSEFAINTFTTGHQSLTGRVQTVEVDADGDAFVVWNSDGQDGSGYGVYGQRFTSAGAKVGGEFLINTYTTNYQTLASVALDADGDALVVWASGGQDGSSGGIYGQRFNSAGAKVGGEFPINTYTTNNQSLPSVAMDADGDAVVVWSSSGQDGSFEGIYGQRFDSAGAKVGAEFQINTYTTSSQIYPTVAMDADGDAVVVWSSNSQDNPVGEGIYGQRFNSAGAKVGGEFPINTHTTNNQTWPAVAVDADGDAVVVWASYLQDGSSFGAYGQRFNSTGGKVGGEFRINSFTQNSQEFPSVAMDADGDAVVVWTSFGQDGNQHGVYALRFNSAGAKVGGEFVINTYTTNHQAHASVALDADGDAVVVWESLGQDGSGWGVYGQRFQPLIPAAKVSNIQVNDGSAQRSMVTSIQVIFDSKVSFAGSPSAAFSLVNQGTSNAATLSATVDVSGTEVTLAFTGGSVDLGGSLSDGRYTLTILGGQFTGGGFDGNGDGTAGDDYILIGSPANGLFRFFGDADGDGTVAASDCIPFRLSFGGVNSIFDFENDGNVGASDFIQFRLRFGGSV